MASVEDPFIEFEKVAREYLPVFKRFCLRETDGLDEGVFSIIPVNYFDGFFEVKGSGFTIISHSAPVVDAIGCVGGLLYF